MKASIPGLLSTTPNTQLIVLVVAVKVVSEAKGSEIQRPKSASCSELVLDSATAEVAAFPALLPNSPAKVALESSQAPRLVVGVNPGVAFDM
ncbi:hypothetical protein A2865_04695 [Candidatus Woesebacteria bacterium RIFCSPHIGHO2_01_FULL_39_17]|nr:MAG: hypothetical protein A2865_04695 [Candidatus Woesebacteria bacterium RIFCSPHIGHO2_01_FULL_39_17]